MNAKIQELRGRLAASDARGQAASNDNKRLLSEKQVLEDRVGNLESVLACARQEIDDRSQKYVVVPSQVDRIYIYPSRLQQANMRCQVLSYFSPLPLPLHWLTNDIAHLGA